MVQNWKTVVDVGEQYAQRAADIDNVAESMVVMAA